MLSCLGPKQKKRGEKNEKIVECSRKDEEEELKKKKKRKIRKHVDEVSQMNRIGFFLNRI